MRAWRATAGRLAPGDRSALGLWLWSRLGVAVLATAGAFALTAPREDLRSPLQLWRRWDADLLRKIAEHGYGGYPDAYPDRGVEAFFPGFPLLLRAVHVVVPGWTAAGLLVSLVAGAVACVALARLARRQGLDGDRAVLALLLGPSAVFLAAGYTEALFLALALPAWLAAQDGRWRAAGLLAAGASAVRVNGLFLTAALVVLFAVQVRRPRRDALWLLAPVAVVLAYAAYLRALTGDWLRWFRAQEEGWHRELTAPWDAAEATWRMVGWQGAFGYVALLELAAVVVGVVVTGVLLRRRCWPEAVYVGLSVAALATSTFFLSVARSTLLWFPLWLLVAGTPRLWRPFVAVSAPLMAVGVVLFTTGRWAG